MTLYGAKMGPKVSHVSSSTITFATVQMGRMNLVRSFIFLIIVKLLADSKCRFNSGGKLIGEGFSSCWCQDFENILGMKVIAV